MVHANDAVAGELPDIFGVGGVTMTAYPIRCWRVPAIGGSVFPLLKKWNVFNFESL